MQQVPEEIESVMVGIEAYLSIRRHNSDTGLSFFEDDDESGRAVVEKVSFSFVVTLCCYHIYAKVQTGAS